MTRIYLSILLLAVCAPFPAAAQSSGAAPEPSAYDSIWKRVAELYKDDDNRVVQQVLFTGRFQHDLATVDADEGEHRESNIRRLRIGPRITFLRRYLFHAEVELNPQERDPLYVRFTDLYVQWSRNSAVAVTVGKQSVPFTLDGATSSKELITIDRSNLANNIWFPQEYIPGVSVAGRVAPWVYRAGVYSAGAANREFGEFSGGLFALGTIGYDFATSVGVSQALLSGNYVYQQPDRDNTFTRQLEHVASVSFKLDGGRWGVNSDLSAAAGYFGQSDLWGLTVMPFVDASDKLQFVGRYTFLDSERANGVQLASYENRVVRGRGDRYDELYLGANYFFYGHKLKLQTGVQWADLQDAAGDGGAYSGVAWTTGLRTSW